MRTLKMLAIIKKINSQTTPELICEITNNRILRYRVMWKQKGKLCLSHLGTFKSDKPPYLKGFSLGVLLNDSPEERLIAFLHEIFHVIYYDNGIPSIENLRLYKQKDLLETSVEENALNFISKHRPFCEKLFEIKFKIKHIDFWEK
jgi:hypothetical protein